MPSCQNGVRAVLIVLVFLVSGASAFAGQDKVTIDLSQAVQLALDNPLNLKPVEAGLTQAEAAINKAKAGKLPSASVSGSYTRLGEAPPSFDFATMMPIEGSPNVYSTSIDLQWPIYTGGSISNGLKLAELGRGSAQAEYDQAVSSTVYQAVQGYISLLKAQGFVRISQDYVKTITEHLKLVETNFELGYSTKSDLLETKVRLSQAEQALLKAEHGQKLAEESLKNLLGVAETAELELAGLNRNPGEFGVPTLDAAYSAALEKRPELAGLRSAKNMAEVGLELAEAYKLPSVMLMGSYSTQGDTIDLGGGDWRMTVAAQWKAFDGGAGKAGVAEAQAGLDKVSYSLDKAVNGIKLEIRQKHLAVSEAQKSRNLTTMGLQHAQESFDFATTKFKLGAATNLELLTAENSLNQAKNDDLNARYDYYLVLVDLYKAMGEIEQIVSGVDENA